MRDTRRTRLVLALLLLTSFTVITLDYRANGSGPLQSLREVASAVFGPVERAVTAVVRPVGGLFTDVGDIGKHKKQIAELEAENEQLRTQLRTTEAMRRRLAETESMLQLAGRGRFRVVGARVVGVGNAFGFEWTATIDAGSRDGIRPDMTVINGDGLVGRVKTVGPTTSTVLLAADPEFGAGARLERSGEIGHVDGGGRRPMRFTLLSAQTRLAPGQRLVTLGSTGNKPFVPEVPIGRITTVETTPGALTRTALVEPYVDFTALDVVGVVVAAPDRIPRDSLLPPSPTPSPGPTRAPVTPASPAPGATPSAGTSASPTRTP